MLRILGVLLAVCCIATVFSQVVIVGWLWMMGRFSQDNLMTLKQVLSGQTPIAESDEMPEEPPQSSLDEVIKERAARSAELDAQKSQLTVLLSLVRTGREDLLNEQKRVDQIKQDFEDRLVALEEQISNLALEQARGVLLAMTPIEASDRLMELSVDDCVLLLREMPEKSIARILKEMQDTDTPPDEPIKIGGKTERGNKIFKALQEGDPKKRLVKEAREELQKPSLPTNGTGNNPSE